MAGHARRPATTTTRAVLLTVALVAAGCSGRDEGGRPSGSTAPTATTASVTTAGVTTPAPGTTRMTATTAGAPTTVTTVTTTTVTTTTVPTTTVPTTTVVPGPPFQAAGTEAARDFPGSNAPAVLVAVRVGRHDGFERVVFEFRAGDELPGVLVGYVPLPVRADPSDLPIEISGDHALAVRMQAASRFTLDQEAVLVYPGPNRVAGTGAAVSEVVLRGDFEALLSWVIGLRGARPFRVFTLDGPPRVVVDVATIGQDLRP